MSDLDSVIEITDASGIEAPRNFCCKNNSSLVFDAQLIDLSPGCNKSQYNSVTVVDDLVVDATLPHFEYFEHVNDELIRLDELWNNIGYNQKERDRKIKKQFRTLIEKAEKESTKLTAKIDQKYERIESLQSLLQNEDLTLVLNCSTLRQENKMLRGIIDELEQEKECRLAEYQNTLDILNKLLFELGLPAEPEQDIVPSEKCLIELSNRMNELKCKYEENEISMTYLIKDILEYFDYFSLTCLHESQSNKVAISFHSLFSLYQNEKVKPLIEDVIMFLNVDQLRPYSSDTIKQATEFLAELKRQEAFYRLSIKDFNILIRGYYALFRKIGIEEFPTYLAKSRELENQQEILKEKKNLQRHLNELELFKRSNLKVIVDRIRAKISEYLEKMFIDVSEFGDCDLDKALFLEDESCAASHFEDYLRLYASIAKYEECLEDLEWRYQEYELLYSKAAEWMAKWTEFVVFETRTNDLKRLQIKRYDYFNDEKKRNDFQASLLQLESDLVLLGQKYENENDGEKFSINGQEYSLFIESKKSKFEKQRFKQVVIRKLKQRKRNCFKSTKRLQNQKLNRPICNTKNALLTYAKHDWEYFQNQLHSDLTYEQFMNGIHLDCNSSLIID